MKKTIFFCFSLLLVLCSCTSKEPGECVDCQAYLQGKWYIQDYTLAGSSIYDLQNACDSGSWIDLKADSICEALIKCNDPVNTVSGTWSRNGNQMTLDCPIFVSFPLGIEKNGTITSITENELTFETHTTGPIVPLKVKIFLTKTP